MNNVLVARKHPSLEQNISNVNPSKGQKLAPALEKYTSSTDIYSRNTVIVRLHGNHSQSQDVSYISCDVLDKQIKELQVRFLICFFHYKLPFSPSLFNDKILYCYKYLCCCI